jgi:ribosomal protein S27AE
LGWVIDLNSGTLLKYEFEKDIYRFKNMKWWTRKSWLNDKNPTCPRCGNKHFIED